MKKLKCCVIDDEPLAQELIKGYIERTPFLEYVASFSSASMAIKTIIETEIDLVFLDIQMSELNGIEFARVIPSRCKIIFITAYDKYAVDAFRANATDYLLKPVNYLDFMTSVNKALQLIQLEQKAHKEVPQEEDFVIVKSEYKLIQIAISKILFIESVKDYVRIYLDNDTAVMSLMSIKNIEDRLPKSRFLRVHRSFIVQTSKIKLIERNRIVFEDYTPDELYSIFKMRADKEGYKLDPMAENAVRGRLTMMYNKRGRSFGNGRDARNLFDEVKSNLAARLAEEVGSVTPEQRKTIMMEDVL